MIASSLRMKGSVSRVRDVPIGPPVVEFRIELADTVDEKEFREISQAELDRILGAMVDIWKCSRGAYKKSGPHQRKVRPNNGIYEA
jgi:hypothetical protein